MGIRDELGTISSDLKRAAVEWEQIIKQYSKIIENLNESCNSLFPAVNVELVTEDVESTIEIFGRLFHTQLMPLLKEHELVGRCVLLQMNGDDLETLTAFDINRHGTAYSLDGRQLFYGDGWGMEGMLTFLKPLHEALKRPVFS